MTAFGFRLHTEALSSQWKSCPKNDNPVHKSLTGLRFIFVPVQKESQVFGISLQAEISKKSILRMKKLILVSVHLLVPPGLKVMLQVYNISDLVRYFYQNMLVYDRMQTLMKCKNFPILSFFIKYIDQLWCYSSWIVICKDTLSWLQVSETFFSQDENHLAVIISIAGFPLHFWFV